MLENSYDDRFPIMTTVRKLSEIKSEPINWLWPGRFARGKVSIIAGDPGLGKSQLTAFMASVVTNGGAWPIDNSDSPKGSVIFLSAEDDVADTIRPRLEAVGADLDKTYVLDSIKDIDEKSGDIIERSLNLKRDIRALDELLKKIGDVALVVIDPISAYLGGTDSHKNADMRALLGPLSSLASKHQAAFIGITHLNKSESKNVLSRVMGSTAFVAAARSGYVVSKDPKNDQRRLLLPIKNNIGIDQTGYAFSIYEYILDSGIKTSKVDFEDELVTDTADSILQSNGNSTISALDEAIEFLENTCMSSVPVNEIKIQAEQACISWATVRRAKDKLGIKPQKTSKEGGWVWQLPQDAQDAQ